MNTSETLMYGVWSAIKSRCNNPANEAYPRYGARGIKMCPQWEASFEQFLKDVGDRPSPNHSLDRRENDKGYEPSNVRWATETEQQRNRRDNKLLTIGSETLTQAEWAERAGITQQLLYRRLKAGQTPEQATASPIRRQERRSLQFKGETLTVPQWAARAGISSGVILRRLAAGWPTEQALTSPANRGKSPLPRSKTQSVQL